ncbi:ABC transporter ATP-binding protein [Leucobacter denitrificans]|uniref:ABC transporter ATP-binding protein n=1 Tax=Leucobacter denitrificans TaxID=683042 RepID=A0A7G9S3E5_9MICO|nr:ABC transporter ATP-binding protein [Leucobacter denitrificans]
MNLSIQEGEFVTLLGPSGCGKTTLLRSICGLSAPTEGTIHIGGTLVDDPAAGVYLPPNKRELGMVFQSYALWPHMTVRGNVAYPLKARKRDRASIARRVEEALERVGLAGLGERQVSDLSGGQQQRVAFARALVDRPKVILLDEPLSNLDASLRIDMRQELRDLHRQLGMTTIFVTHDQEEAMTLSDRIVLMRKGAIMQEGPPEELFATPARPFVAEFLGYDNMVPATVAQGGDEFVVVRSHLWAGDLVVKTPAPLQTGDEVRVAIRASSISVSHISEAESDSRSGARVHDVKFLGEDIEYSLRAGDLTLLARVPAQAERIGVGSRVSLDIASRVAVAFGQDSNDVLGGSPAYSAPQGTGVLTVPTKLGVS